VERPNYHLLDFWAVAGEGSTSRACKAWLPAQPTLSGQLRSLEEPLGQRLFDRVGCNRVPIHVGHVVYRYAGEIFGLSRELLDILKGRPTGGLLELTEGVTEQVPKRIAHQPLEPVPRLPGPVRMVFDEDKPERLLGSPAVHELDLVLSGASALLPARNTRLRRSVDGWLEAAVARLRVVGEFEDGALLEVLDALGEDFLRAPRVLEKEKVPQDGVPPIGSADTGRERFYELSVERNSKHPAVLALPEAAREQFLV